MRNIILWVTRIHRLVIFAAFTLVTWNTLELNSQQHEPSKVNATVESTGMVHSASLNFSGTATSAWADLSNVRVKVVTHGRPLFVGIVPENQKPGHPPEPYTIAMTSPAFSELAIMIVRDSNFEVATFHSSISMRSSPPLSMEIPLTMNAIDLPDAGTHVYTVRLLVMQGNVEIKGARLVAYEL